MIGHSHRVDSDKKNLDGHNRIIEDVVFPVPFRSSPRIVASLRVEQPGSPEHFWGIMTTKVTEKGFLCQIFVNPDDLRESGKIVAFIDYIAYNN